MIEIDPFDMSELERHKFAILGRFDAYMTAYKHDIDDFVISVRNHNKKFGAKKKLKSVLKNSRRRTEFISDAFEHLRELREIKIPGLTFDRERLLQDMLTIDALNDAMAEAEIAGLRRANGKTTFQISTRRIKTRSKNVAVHIELSACDTTVLKDVINRARSVSRWLEAGASKLKRTQPPQPDAIREHHMA